MQIIDNQNKLDNFILNLQSETVIGFDTEFVREQTYWPDLCLIQIATQNDQFIVDIKSKLNFDCLWDIIQNPKIEKLIHSCKQDIEAIYYLSGRVITPIFDTQMAAMFCGFKDSISYAQLVKEILDIDLDKDLQYLIKEELSKSKDIFQNIGSAAILMDINNGNILSMLSLPDFDLNKREKINDVKYINRATKGVYEFGSVFKTFTLAAGLQYNVVEPETEFKDLKKRITCAGNSISEYDDKIPSDLTAEEILIRSGNIGSVRIAEKVGIENYNEFLQTIGIISNLEFDIQEVGTTQLGRWGKCKLATIAFGHGIATTLLQLSKGYSIISNGGYEVTPTLLKKEKLQRQRILNENLSETINPILRKIVSTKEGTAGFADVKGYEIGGKTGTADQPSKGGYSKKKVNTFASVFPTSDPKFVLAVMLDEPKANREFVYHYRDNRYPYKGNWRNTAGWTTVWVTGQIMDKIGPILATKY